MCCDFTHLIILTLAFSPAYLLSSVSHAAFDESYFRNFDYSKLKSKTISGTLLNTFLRSIVIRKYYDLFTLLALSLISPPDTTSEEKSFIAQHNSRNSMVTRYVSIRMSLHCDSQDVDDCRQREDQPVKIL